MKNDWILDVLADLRTFASSNDMGTLAEQLDNTMLVAASELVSRTGEAYTCVNASTGTTGKDPRSTGRHQRA